MADLSVVVAGQGLGLSQIMGLPPIGASLAETLRVSRSLTISRTDEGDRTVSLSETLKVGRTFNQGLSSTGDNIIAAARLPGGVVALPNTYWSTSGATIVERSQYGSTISAYTGTAATINTAIADASGAGGGMVVLGAGTFSLSTSIVMAANVTLRGQGMSTIVSFTNMGGSGYYWGAGEVGILAQGSYSGSTDSLPPSYGGVPAGNNRSWTGTNGQSGVYTQGATVLNLDSTTGLSANQMLTLWQSDDADASVPAAGAIVSYKVTGSGSLGISWYGGGEGGATSCQQRVKVVSVDSGTQITVSPGLLAAPGMWRTDRTPKAGWQGGAEIRGAGIEDMLIRSTAYGSAQWGLVDFWQASNCWITRCAFEPRTGAHQAGNTIQHVVMAFEARHITISSCWFGRAVGGAFGSSTSYGVRMLHDSASRVENNIFYWVDNPIMLESPSGSLIAHNYEVIGADTENGCQCHDCYPYMNLFEGNSVDKIMYAVYHGSNGLQTLFRNHTNGTSTGVDIWSYGRYWNVIGNVFTASAIYKSLATDSTKYSRWDGAGLRLGYPIQTAAGGPELGVAADDDVWLGGMFWGNYSAADNTNHFDSADVPSGDAIYPNPVPPNQTLPTSMAYSARPSYFTLASPISVTVAWPPIGPEVTGGTYLGGRAHKLPAQLMYEYAGGTMANFDPSLYG